MKLIYMQDVKLGLRNNQRCCTNCQNSYRHKTRIQSLIKGNSTIPILSYKYYFCYQKKHNLFQIVLYLSGNVLLSQGLASQLPSALRSLTSVFGMGTGVTFSLSPPDYLN